MSNEKEAFGALLRRLIKDAGITQSEFYERAEITKPYFYDILRGNPPPPYLQKLFMEILKAPHQDVLTFYDLAAHIREELPADVQLAVKEHTSLIPQFRALIEHTEQEKHHE
ncbi:MAG: helix-turn-helix domain-containing protein [Oscillospiraceae bacterium]|nr:helix-turn-helix domain-containing protein [Oscillospiraceae bacterium]MBQ9046172.1 helix-turn-helix domain-containing protein [Oscillospiraceae bacterium]